MIQEAISVVGAYLHMEIIIRQSNLLLSIRMHT